MPRGGVDELLQRQSKDYIGQLLYPSMLGAAHELPQLMEGLSKTYGISRASPVILFGFSAGGAAALLSLTEADVHPRAVLVVNAPLSIAQAVDAYERQSKNVYMWTESAKDASTQYDVEKRADRITRANPKTAFLLLQSEHDAGRTVQAAQSAAAALKSAASRYRADPDISAKELSGADHYVFGGSESAATEQMIVDWIKQHAFSAELSCYGIKACRLKKDL
jgi:alpha-beta hydrolase superfamily lysophospholipase